MDRLGLLLKLDREVAYPPLPLNLTGKIANNIELLCWAIRMDCPLNSLTTAMLKEIRKMISLTAI